MVIMVHNFLYFDSYCSVTGLLQRASLLLYLFTQGYIYRIIGPC